MGAENPWLSLKPAVELFVRQLPWPHYTWFGQTGGSEVSCTLFHHGGTRLSHQVKQSQGGRTGSQQSESLQKPFRPMIHINSCQFQKNLNRFLVGNFTSFYILLNFYFFISVSHKTRKTSFTSLTITVEQKETWK